MVSVAIIGADGAGKSTMAARLVSEHPGRFRYLYMGMNPASSNRALPTSRMVHAAKTRRAVNRGEPPGSLHSVDHRRDTRGPVWAAVRLLNRVAEEWFRQLISWQLQIRGFVVIYDRHFLFDHSHGNMSGRRLTDRMHNWHLRHLYPRPTVVLYLKARPEVLHARKPETTLRYLEKRQQAFEMVGAGLPRFHTIDAEQNEDRVYADICRCLEWIRGKETGGK